MVGVHGAAKIDRRLLNDLAGFVIHVSVERRMLLERPADREHDERQQTEFAAEHLRVFLALAI